MSPSPSGPYQSRFLRAIFSQTRRWLDRSQQAVRNVQVAAGWSVQILLYPVYALFQTTRLVGQQIGKVAQPEFPRLNVPATEQTGVTLPAHPPLTADRPLQQVLQTVQSFAMTPIPIAIQQTEVVIRGIAMQLEGRSLVLVTQQNQILDILTGEQQQALEQQITWIVAEYGRRSGFWRLPHWIGTKIRSLFGAAPSTSALPAPATGSLTLPGATELQVDAPIWQSLVTVQHFLEATERREQATQLAIASALAPASNMFIRGIASLIDERSLVLVTNQNQLLNVLTCEQQNIIHRRIVWEVANYYRYLQLRQRAQGLTPLQPPSRNSQAWFPVQVFQGVMAWMQTGPIAIATNLFQEASLPPASWPELDSLRRLPDQTTSTLPALFQKLQDSLIAVLNPSPQPPQVENSSPAGSASLTPATQSAPTVAEPSALRQQHRSNPLVDTEERSPEFIEIDVTLVGYEFSWLERVIRWLDRCFLWVESAWNGLFNGKPDRSSPTRED